MRLTGATNASYTGTFNGGSFNPNGPYTLAFWARPTTDPPSSAYEVALTNGAGGKIALRFLSTGDVNYVDNRDSGFTNLSTLYSSFPFSTWAHWAVSYDGANYTIFQDGAAVKGPNVASAFSGRAALTTVSITTDAQATSDFNVADLFVFDQALSAAQVQGLRRGAWPVVGTASSHVFGWWRLPRNATGVDRSQTNSPFTTGTVGPQLDFIERRYIDGASWWRRLILPQYLAQPPIAATIGSFTNAPPAAVALSQALTIAPAATTANIPSATITSASALASTAAAAVTNAPSSAITAGAPVVSNVANAAATKTDAPSASIVSRPAVASTAAAVTNAPTATVNPSYPIVSVAGSVTNASGAITASATIASVSAAVTNAPSASIGGGMSAVALSTTDIPAVLLQRNLPIIGAAGAVTNANAAVGANAPVASTAANVTNAPSATISPTGTVASVASTASNCPAVSISAAANIACVSSAVTNCPPATLLAGRPIISTASAVSNCPPANVVPLAFLSVNSVCTTRTDCPAPPPMTFFFDLAAPPIPQRRQWPPRPR